MNKVKVWRYESREPLKRVVSNPKERISDFFFTVLNNFFTHCDVDPQLGERSL